MVKKVEVPTKEEVDARYREKNEGDFLGFECDIYTDFMSFKYLRKIAKPEVTDKEIREKWMRTLKREEILKQARKYMKFAWEKANGCRGISASRSFSHYIAWIWLAGDKEFSEKLERESYEYYGKDVLLEICDFYGWEEEKKFDDGIRTNTGD